MSYDYDYEADHGYRRSFTVGEVVTCTAETAKAILVNVDGEDCWVPKSQLMDDSECYEKGTSGTLVVSQWFAEKVGWA